MNSLWLAGALLAVNSANAATSRRDLGLVIKDVTVATLQTWFEMSNLTSVQLCECYVKRIEAVKPYVHNVIEINPDLYEIAASLDAERANGTTRGPLHGIPIVTKDNLYTDDKFNTTDGNLALLGSRWLKDATVIKKLRAAGVVLLGHANESEDADHRSVKQFSEGWSDRGGQTRNAWNGTQQTAGSSTGSAQAVAGYLVPLAVGTETHGSVLHPAGHGLKPTVGLTSRRGVIPGSHNQDSVGAFGRNVHDAALLLDAMYGVDEEDDKTFAQIGHTPAGGYAAFAADKSALAGAVFGIPYQVWWSTVAGFRAPGNADKLLARLTQLKEAGATIINITEPLPYVDEIQNRFGWGDAVNTSWALASQRYLLVDMYNSYSQYMSELTWPNRSTAATLAPMRNLGDLVDALVGAVATGGIRDDIYWNALLWRQARARAAIDGGYVHTFENGTTITLDGLLIPNLGGGGASSAIASVPAAAGYPAITVPVDLDPYHLPIGLGIWGRQFSEEKLVKWASAMEDLFQFNKDFEPQYFNYDTEVMPFHARWPGWSCSQQSLAALSCAL
ncbi:amidase family protein [Mycena vulgaris]|nr:amidase family protein [Mycena vulgaris]